MPPRPARFSTTSFKAKALVNTLPLRTIEPSSKVRHSLSYLPSSTDFTASIERSTGISVINPKRPWLIPTKGTLYRAKVRATPSMVPSPPMTMARSAVLPISSTLAVGYSWTCVLSAVACSIKTLTCACSSTLASSRKGPSIPESW